MKVVLEGPDNAGKTTLAKRLREQVTGLEYFHPGGAPANTDAEIGCLTQQHDMMQSRNRIILDRVTCISQQVYNSDIAGDWQRQQYADMMVATPGLVVIYCRPPNEVLMDVGNYKWRPEETEEHRQKIISRAMEFVHRYDEVMLRVPCISYDWKDAAHAQVIEQKLVQGLYGREDAATWFHNVIDFGGRR